MNFGRSKRGTPAKTTVPTNRGVSITILGAICNAAVINISLRKPEAVASSKKRNHDGKKATTLNSRVGTRTEHYLEFISSVIDVLDAHDMEGTYLVMDNAPIRRNKAIRQLIESRVYLPTYSPFLNPIEEFWAKVKARDLKLLNFRDG